MKWAAKTASTPPAPQNKKKVATVPNKKDLITHSVLGDAAQWNVETYGYTRGLRSLTLHNEK